MQKGHETPNSILSFTKREKKKNWRELPLTGSTLELSSFGRVTKMSFYCNMQWKS